MTWASATTARANRLGEAALELVVVLKVALAAVLAGVAPT